MSQFGKLNYINVGPGGTFKPSGNLYTSVTDIDAIFEHLAQTNAPKLAVHFHGGLVKEANGEQTARSMQPVYEGGGAHSLTFIWETGLIETITRNLTRINDTKLFQKLLRYVFRQLTKRLGADISGRGPGEAMSMAEIEAELEKLEKFEAFDARARGGAQRLDEAALEQAEAEMTNEFQIELQSDRDFLESEDRLLFEETYLKAEHQEDLREDGKGLDLLMVAKTLAKVTYRVLRRYWKGRDHGLYPTTVEEIVREFYLADFGEWVWGRMKNVAENMWLPNTRPLGAGSHPGAYFLEKLKAHQTANPGFTVDLIGHSAGAIAICHMLRQADAAGMMPTIRNIVFLAPACLMKLMHDEVVQKQDRYDAFRMFTMLDEFEKKDRLVPAVYTRSLLYLISGVLEPEVDIPIAGMERFWTGEEPFDQDYLVETVAWLKADGKNRSVMSVTNGGGGGLSSASEKHGDFDNDAATRGSLTYIVSQSGAGDGV